MFKEVKEILEKSSILLEKDAGSLDKALNLLVIGLYALTATQLQAYAQVLEIFIPSSGVLAEHTKVIAMLIASVFAFAGYFILIEVSIFIQDKVSDIAISLEYFFRCIFRISRKSTLQKSYRDDPNIVKKYDVERYLEINQDERIKEQLDIHNKFVSRLMDRKRSVISVSILLSVIFYVNGQQISIIANHPGMYWSVVIGLILWSSILPYENMMYMYIHNNKIRD